MRQTLRKRKSTIKNPDEKKKDSLRNAKQSRDWIVSEARNKDIFK